MLVAALVALLRLLILKFLAVLLDTTVCATGRVVLTGGAARPDSRFKLLLLRPLRPDCSRAPIFERSVRPLETNRS